MQGKWVGEGTSEMGQGSGYFTFDPISAAKSGFGAITRSTQARTDVPRPSTKM